MKTGGEKTSCPTCPMRPACHPDAEAPVEGALSGGRLVAASAGYLLAPLAVAIAAAAITTGETARVIAAGAAFAAVEAVAVTVGFILHRKRSS